MKEFKRWLLIFIFCLVCAGTVFAQDKAEEPEAIAEYLPPQPDAPGESFIGFIGTMFKIGISLSVIVLFVYLTLFVLKKVTSGGSRDQELSLGSLFMVDSLSLRPQQKVFLVKAGKEILVLASSEKELTLLSRIGDQAEVEEILRHREEKWKQAKPFGTYLAAAEKKHYLKMYVQEYMDSVKNIFKGKAKA